MGNPTIRPDVFARAMQTHWRDTLNNVSSPALVSLWETMGKAFNQAMSGSSKQWLVLQPPTGTGKTQGLAVYSALTARENKYSQLTNGILIVTRLIEQAEELKDRINLLAGFECAITKHSDNEVTSEEMRDSDILIITHAAYVRALDGLCQRDDSRWTDLIQWRGGKRCLTVIDEALANIIDTYQVKAENLRLTLAYINQEMAKQYPYQVKALETVKLLLERVADITKFDETDYQNSSRVVWRGVFDQRVSFPNGLSMRPLRDAMESLRYDLITLHKESLSDRKRIANNVDNTLKAVESILSRWSWYTKKGLEHSFNCAELLIPEDLPAPVVLDATAKQNFLWELLEDKTSIKPVPSNTRSYQNVTLHVTRANSIGKNAMIANGQSRIPRLLAHLEHDLGSKRKVFLCVHQKIEHIPLNYAPDFEAFSVGHWGAIDGLNDWEDYDTAVIFGIPYRDHIWATNTFFALQGLQDNEWLKNPKWKAYADVRDELQTKQITVSVVQAINRIQCRRVIDELGNCSKSDVFIVLPKGTLGDRILEAIRQEMPSIQAIDWDFQLDGEKAQVRRNSSHEALIVFMSNRLAGETSMTQVQKELGLSQANTKKLRAILRESKHPLTISLAKIGVSLASTGYGKGSKTYLTKI